MDAYVAGWGAPEGPREEFRAYARPWFLEPDWKLHVVKIRGKRAAAAAAAAFLREGIGYFADATTAPNFRGRGLHGSAAEQTVCRSVIATWKERECA